jgi:hypothetical protein
VTRCGAITDDPTCAGRDDPACNPAERDRQSVKLYRRGFLKGIHMKSSPRLYVVTMYRYADKEKHSYVHGVFSTFEKAEKSGEKELLYRGGNKYFPEIISFTLDSLKYPKIEKRLPKQL